MSRSIFGWDYPPGAALDPNAPYNQNGPYICDVCLCDQEVDCQCVECPVCHEHGNPKCYSEGHEIGVDLFLDIERKTRDIKIGFIWTKDTGRFCLTLHPDVRAGRIGRATLMAIWDLETAQQEELYAREMDEGYEVERISDKWR